MSKIKNLKFIIILFVTILAFGFSSCYAVDLDLSEDLTTNDFSNNSTSNTSSNTTNNSFDDNTTFGSNSNSNNTNTNTSNSNNNSSIQTHQTLLEVVLLQQL